MDISSNKAASAYAAQMRNAMGGGEAEDTAAGAAGGAFSDLLSKAIDTVVESQHSAETAKMQAVTGKIDTAELVTALASAELTLNTVVAIRDRVISAYQDIIRMPM